MRNKDKETSIQKGRGGILPESNEPSTGLIPLVTDRWLDLGVDSLTSCFLST